MSTLSPPARCVLLPSQRWPLWSQEGSRQDAWCFSANAPGRPVLAQSHLHPQLPLCPTLQIKNITLQSTRVDMKTQLAGGFIQGNSLILFPIDEASRCPLPGC